MGNLENITRRDIERNSVIGKMYMGSIIELIDAEEFLCNYLGINASELNETRKRISSH